MARRGAVTRSGNRFWSGLVVGQTFADDELYRFVKVVNGNEVVLLNSIDDIPVGIIIRESPLQVEKLRHGAELRCRVAPGVALVPDFEVTYDANGYLNSADDTSYVMGVIVEDFAQQTLASFYCAPRSVGGTGSSGGGAGVTHIAMMIDQDSGSGIVEIGEFLPSLPQDLPAGEVFPKDHKFVLRIPIGFDNSIGILQMATPEDEEGDVVDTDGVDVDGTDVTAGVLYDFIFRANDIVLLGRTIQSDDIEVLYDDGDTPQTALANDTWRALTLSRVLKAEDDEREVEIKLVYDNATTGGDTTLVTYARFDVRTFRLFSVRDSIDEAGDNDDVSETILMWAPRAIVDELSDFNHSLLYIGKGTAEDMLIIGSQHAGGYINPRIRIRLLRE